MSQNIERETTAALSEEIHRSNGQIKINLPPSEEFLLFQTKTESPEETPFDAEGETPSDAPPRQRPKLAGWMVSVVVVAITAILVFYLLFGAKTEHTTVETETDAAPNQKQTALLSPEQQQEIAVETVELHGVQADLNAPGRVALNENRVTPVFSQFSGRLIKISAEIGDTVRAGQVIGTIDTPDIVGTENDFQQTLTALKTARSSLQTATTSLRTAKTSEQTAATGLRTAKTAFDLAKRTRERNERLFAAEAIPLRELEQSRADQATAKDDVSRAEDEVSRAADEASRAADEISRAQNEVRKAQAAVDAARLRLQSAGLKTDEIARLETGARAANRLTPLVAPIDGTVIERNAGAGQFVQPGEGEPLLKIADLSNVWVNAELYEDQVAAVRVGSTVKIETPAYPNDSFVAQIDQIGALLDAERRTIPVRCLVTNSGARLKPGMFATVSLNLMRTENALTVPVSAILTEGEQRAIFVEEAPGRYVKRQIEIGGERSGSVIVRQGLSEGERVVVRGGLLLNNAQNTRS